MSDSLSPAAVLVAGEALIDVVERPGRLAREYVGGSPANVALGLGRWAIPVRLRTALAHDARGEAIRNHLEASGVVLDDESFVLDRTSTAIARISAGGDSRYEFDIDWRIDPQIEIGAAAVVHVGSIGCFLEPGASEVRRLVRTVAGTARVTFDPNIRPALLGHRAAVVDVAEEIAAVAELVKLSDEDAAWLYPGASVDEVMDRLLSLGARIVVVTRGTAGAALASRDARAQVAARRVDMRDTIGAGDAFMAALIASLATGRLATDAASLRAAGETAAVAASITVGRVGADLPTKAEVDEVLIGGP